MGDETPEVLDLRPGEEARLHTGRPHRLRLSPEPFPEFEISVSLSESGSDDILIPLDPKNDGWRKSSARFTITVESDQKDFQSALSEIMIWCRDRVIFRNHYPHNFRTPGTHPWSWNGFSSGGVLDTELLKDKSLRITASLKYSRTTKLGHLKLHNTPYQVPWVDTRVHLNLRKVFVKVYINCQNEESLPAAKFNHLRDLAKRGIQRYWSRTITVDGDAWTVETTPVEREEDAEALDLYWVTDKEYHRSHNSGIIDATIFYNAGYWGTDQLSCDAEFMVTAAHEFGHAILEGYGGKDLSWGHKGTVGSSLLKFWNFQAPLDSAPHFPASGEIDLMKYYHEDSTMPGDYNHRVIAAEEDVKRLIWLSQVNFNDA